MTDAVSIVQSANANCKELIVKRIACWDFHGSKDTENCFVEELEEKRCLAFQLCPSNAASYYGSMTSIGKAQCALWAEAFAYQVMDGAITSDQVSRHQTARESVTKSPELQKKCRKITMDLAKCLSGYPIGRSG